MNTDNFKKITEKIDNTSKKITEKIDDASKKVDSIMHNRLIIAIFMIVDGINFVINPVNSMEFMARTVALLALFAAGAIVVTNMKSKNIDKKSTIISSVTMIVCIYLLIFPKILAINIRVLSAIFIISNGLINIFNVTKMDKISNFMINTENDIKSKLDNNEINKNFDKGILKEQTDKVLNPLTNVVEKANKKSWLYLVLNIIYVILGIFLFTTNNGTLIICGIILIYSGVCDFLMFTKSIKLSKKIQWPLKISIK